MKNPLNKRLLRSFKSEFGKYAVLFIFIAGMISIVSGFLVASGSISSAYDESFEKYNIEDGNFELMYEADEQVIETIEKENVRIYKNFYVEEENKDNGSTIRIFRNRTEVNRVCMLDGRLPQSADEIAIDRMYADNNSIKTGDTVDIGGKKLTVSGLAALSDYSTLYSDPSDLMFDSVKFCVAVMTDEGFENFGDVHMHYSYSWKYEMHPEDNEQAKKMAEDLADVIIENAPIVQFIPEYSNQAIHFAGDDVKGDSMMFTVFLYIVVMIISFIFALTTINTIVKESSVIGTLRASGYSRSELVIHYLTMPVIIMLLASVIGNVLGYTVFKDYMAGMYYGSYSLPSYVTIWNTDAFIKTTVIPIIILFLINFAILTSKLKLSPLSFIRHELKKNKNKKAFKLNTKIKIMKRFRLRIIFQNLPDYLTVIFGIFLANIILLFGLGLEPLLDHYQEEISENMICDHQYILKFPAETETDSAEKYCAYSLSTMDDRMPDESISVYGIYEGSKYINADISSLSGNEVYISDAYANKRDVEKGDTITLKEEYGNREYTFTVKDIYNYPSSLAVFMSDEYFCKVFDKDEGYFNGYFSDNEIDDIDDRFIGTVITLDDMTKTSRQLKVSMGEMMSAFLGFGIVMFMLIIYMLSKIIIEKNAQAISMTKILGYSNGEINGLYILTTSLVVIISVILTIPIVDNLMERIMKIAFSSYSGWLPYYIPFSVYVEMAVMGILAYAVVAFVLISKIKKIPMSDALKNAE